MPKNTKEVVTTEEVILEEVTIEENPIAEFKSKNDAITSLIRGGKDSTEAEAIWKKFGARSKVTGFRAKLYVDLVINPDFAESETLDFAKANGGSENDKKQISHFERIAKLAIDIRADERARVLAEIEAEKPAKK